MPTGSNRWKGFSGQGIFVALLFWLLGLTVLYYGAKGWLPPLASRHGVGIDAMMRYLLYTTGTMMVLGHLVVGYFVWKYSRTDARIPSLPTASTERRWSLLLGVIMALVAEGGVLVIGLPVLGEVYMSDPPEDSVLIEVTAEQFAWNVRYPGADGELGRVRPNLMSLDNPIGIDSGDPASRDDVTLISVFYVPVNRPVLIRLRSKDVLHSFYLPDLRVKQDAVPGLNIDFWFVPTKEGTYELACTELCGFGHFQMRGVFRVVTQQEFETFLREEPPFFGSLSGSRMRTDQQTVARIEEPAHDRFRRASALIHPPLHLQH